MACSAQAHSTAWPGGRARMGNHGSAHCQLQPEAPGRCRPEPKPRKLPGARRPGSGTVRWGLAAGTVPAYFLPSPASRRAMTLEPLILQAAIVDLDGTMVDTLGDFDVALNATLADLGLCGVGRPFIGRTVGKGSEHQRRKPDK